LDEVSLGFQPANPMMFDIKNMLEQRVFHIITV